MHRLRVFLHFFPFFFFFGHTTLHIPFCSNLEHLAFFSSLSQDSFLAAKADVHSVSTTSNTVHLA